MFVYGGNKLHVLSIEFPKSIIKMPHTNRQKCVVCDQTIQTRRIRFLSTNLIRIFVSIDQRKRVTVSDAICDSCRLEYNRWKKLTMGDFDQFDTIDSDNSVPDIEVDDKDETIDSMQMKTTTVTSPVYRCSESHR